MTQQELEQKTVIELRKIAKEESITLGAGLSKKQIVEKIAAAMGDRKPAAPQPAPAKPEAETKENQGPQFHAAWHNPGQRGGRGTYSAQRPGRNPYGATPQPNGPEMPHLTTVRPAHFAPRFGPAVPENREETAQAPAEVRTGNPIPPQQTAMEMPAAPARPAPAEEKPRAPYNAGPRSPAPARPVAENVQPLTLSEMLASHDLVDVTGILELHPDGYGFLRSPVTCLPSVRDIHVSVAVVKRGNLRTGDLICGKVRPQREGDRYTSLLYVSSINGVPTDDCAQRSVFETMDAVYPRRPLRLISLVSRIKLAGLASPFGYGQRALITVPDGMERVPLLRELVEGVRNGDENARIIALMVDDRPEDVTILREDHRCEVISCGFDLSAENRQRLIDLLVEHVERVAEQGQDVVLLVDGLSRLARGASMSMAAAPKGAGAALTSVRARKLFGVGRSLREGGSVTVIALMGNSTEEQVIQEFRAMATLTLTMTPDGGVDLSSASTVHPEYLLDGDQMVGLGIIRQHIKDQDLDGHLPQMLRMMDRAGGAYEVLRRLAVSQNMDEV